MDIKYFGLTDPSPYASCYKMEKRQPSVHGEHIQNYTYIILINCLYNLKERRAIKDSLE